MTKAMIKVTNTDTTETMNIVLPAKNTNSFIELLEAPHAEYKVFEVGNVALEELPEETQIKVKETLTVFDSVNVVYEYGKFEVSAHTCIKAYYNYDHFVCGTYFAKDVYTEEERRQHLAELNSCEFPEWAW